MRSDAAELCSESEGLGWRPRMSDECTSAGCVGAYSALGCRWSAKARAERAVCARAVTLAGREKRSSADRPAEQRNIKIMRYYYTGSRADEPQTPHVPTNVRTQASFDPMYPAALSIGARAQIVPLRPQTSSGCRVIHLRDCTASKTGALSLPSSSKRGAERPVK